MDNINTLIIPDVHGRDFWIDALKRYPIEEYPDIDIVFLGDYLDPYTSFEGITKEQAYDNFLSILDIAKKDKRIKLLLGNHDWHYLFNTDYCRIDNARSRNIENLIKENINLFSLAYEKKINDKLYLFTHAGVTKGWLKANINYAKQDIELWPDDPEEDEYFKYRKTVFENFSNFDIDNDSLADFLNSLLKVDDDVLGGIVGQISRMRGGWFWDGSFIWADVNEHLNNTPFSTIKKYYQIFGHTLTYPDIDEGYVGEFFAMIDSRCAWKLDNENNLIKI